MHCGKYYMTNIVHFWEICHCDIHSEFWGKMMCIRSFIWSEKQFADWFMSVSVVILSEEEIIIFKNVSCKGIVAECQNEGYTKSEICWGRQYKIIL